MVRQALVAAALAVVAGPAAGQVVSPSAETTAITIYRLTAPAEPDEDIRLDDLDANEGLVMIRETRTVDLPAGRSRISFRGVADTMVAQTAAVEGLPGAVIERNQDYNLLTPGALIEAAIGRPVTVVRTDPRTGEVSASRAVVRSGSGGPVLEANGRIEALGCSGAPERLVFDDMPPALTANPTFSVLADAPSAGRYKVRLSYLATGMAWSADYVARIAPGGRILDLTGWITLSNQTSATFRDAPTDVVAGKISHDADTAATVPEPTALARDCWGPRGVKSKVEEIMFAAARIPMPAPPGDGVVQELVVTGSRAQQSDLGDYKLYTLPGTPTVAARQTKQVQFLEQRGVRFERVYSYRFDGEDDLDQEEGPGAPVVLLRLKNKADAGLGKPLPSGTVAILESDPGGAPVLAGQRRIKDVPVGVPLEVEMGRAMDVAVTVAVTEDEDVMDRTEAAVSANFVNDKPIPITLEYRQAVLGDGFKVTRASRRPGKKDGEPIWTFRLAPGERASLTYRMSYE